MHRCVINTPCPGKLAAGLALLEVGGEAIAAPHDNCSLVAGMSWFSGCIS